MKKLKQLAGLMLMLFVIAACGQQAQEATTEEPAEPVATETTSAVRQAYPNLTSEVVFENEQIVAQRMTAEAGAWAGEHSHPGGQIAVVLKGGTVTYREGGEETEQTFADGEVLAVDPVELHDWAVTSDSSMDYVLITFAPGEAGSAPPQDYPNAPAEVELENDRVIVQRLTREPGNWVGEHAHVDNQLVVVLKGSTLTYREGGEETERTFTDGEVFMVDTTVAHDHAVTGDSGVESILITLK